MAPPEFWSALLGCCALEQSPPVSRHKLPPDFELDAVAVDADPPPFVDLACVDLVCDDLACVDLLCVDLAWPEELCVVEAWPDPCDAVVL